MNYGYYNYYTDPLMNYTNFFAVTAVAVLLAVILGIVLFALSSERTMKENSAVLKGSFITS